MSGRTVRSFILIQTSEIMASGKSVPDAPIGVENVSNLSLAL
jgi:hypothetical protein